MRRNGKRIAAAVVGIVALLLVVQIIFDVQKEQKLLAGEKTTEESTDSPTLPLEQGGTASYVVTEEWRAEFAAKIVTLREEFPAGKYWNHMGQDEATDVMQVTETACNHGRYGTKYCNIYVGKSNEAYPYAVAGRQGVGFASLLSDRIFGTEAEAYTFDEYDRIRIGDQARIDGQSHTVFIIEKTDEYIVVAEVNQDTDTCLISWDRKILRKDLSDALYISRYH